MLRKQEIDDIMMIGKFMGFSNELFVYQTQRDPEPLFIYRSKDEDGSTDCDNEINIYDPSSDWNQLMEVYVKIDRLGYNPTIDPWGITFIEYLSGEEKEVLVYENDREYKKITNYFYAVVNFIEWFNGLKVSNP